MYELLLYGQVPIPRHEQVLKILAGVAAMQPRRVLERHIVYKPTREPEEPGAHLSRRGGTQNIIAVKPTKPTGAKDLYYVQLVQRLTDADFGTAGAEADKKGVAASLSAAVRPGDEPRWSLEFQDVPDTGEKGVSIRATSSTDIVSGDPHAWMLAAGPHQFVSEYYVEGHRFILGDVIIFLHRVLHEPGVRSLETAPKVPLPPFAVLQPFDPSGGYMLEAKVRLLDLDNTVVLENGVGQMTGFQQQMSGCVELGLPDRLALDTRVKYKPPPAPPMRRFR